MQDGLGGPVETAKAGAKALWQAARSTWRTAKITIQINFSKVTANWLFEVLPTDTIADVKQQIFDKHKIPSTQQLLSMLGSGVLMDDTQTISDYKLQEDVILHLSLTYVRRPWKIYVEYGTGDPVPVTVFPDKALDMVRIMKRVKLVWTYQSKQML
jgi:hypothetical protein